MATAVRAWRMAGEVEEELPKIRLASGPSLSRFVRRAERMTSVMVVADGGGSRSRRRCNICKEHGEKFSTFRRPGPGLYKKSTFGPGPIDRQY